MAPQDRHGKTAQDYRESLITALDSIAPRPRARRGHPLLWIWLLVPLAALWLNWTSVQGYFFRRVTLATGVSASVTPAAPASVAAPAQVLPAVAARPAVYGTREPPRPLADCLASGTVVNEAVLRCRFGEVPRPQEPAEPGHGMVSDAYMAQYEAERGARSVGHTGNRQVAVESHEISGWDGLYLASWQVVGNEVDASSVCANYRRGLIEYRECRKGAKQWFKNECRAAGHGEAAHQRYCSAASSFSPMG